MAKLSPWRRRALVYALAPLLVAIATVLRFEIEDYTALRYPTYFLAVVTIAMVGGLGPGILGTALSVVCALYYFDDPASGASVKQIDMSARTAIFVVIGVAFSAAAEFLRRARARAVQAERHLKERYWRDNLHELTPSIIFEADGQGQTIFVSQRWTECTGSAASEALGEGWARFVHPDDVDASRRTWMNAVQNGVKIELKHRMRSADGSYRWFLIRARPTRSNDDVVTWVGSATDIDDLLRAQNTLQQADQRKDEFLATLAHELRNPLACFHNAVGALRLASAKCDAASLAPTLEIAERQVRQLSRMVEELLDISRISHDKMALRLEPLDLSDVLREALETCQPLLKSKNHLVESRFPAHPVRVSGDRLRLGQVFVNLIQNAAKYTPAHGRIWIEAKSVGDRATFAVRDNGVGIPSEMLARIFELFAQANFRRPSTDGGLGGGLGVGLALARKIVDLHKGDIEAFSEGENKGSRFIVRLPLEERDETSAAHEKIGCDRFIDGSWSTPTF